MYNIFKKLISEISVIHTVIDIVSAKNVFKLHGKVCSNFMNVQCFQKSARNFKN